MPLQSREVLELRLDLDCKDEPLEIHRGLTIHDPPTPPPTRQPPSLLSLPVELRLKILRHLLRTDRSRQFHTRRPPANGISELVWLDPRHILQAAPFKHKSNQEINGSLPVITTCRLHTAVLKTCKQLYYEGRAVLYDEGEVVALQSGIKGLKAKLMNYGIPVWGPLPASRLITAPKDASRPGYAKFNPVMLFSGQNSKPTTPFYVCSAKDSTDFMHALWIMVESSFARGMKFNLTVPAIPQSRCIDHVDRVVKYAVLPWLHSHIASIGFHGPDGGAARTLPPPSSSSPASNKRLLTLQKELTSYVAAASAEPNVYTYQSICGSLEQVMRQADLCVMQDKYFKAESLYERVCYEASSLVRTRTSKLVDVSSKTKDGINRVCKLIAVSAYRLCELRSGSLGRIVAKAAASPTKETTCDRTSADDLEHGGAGERYQGIQTVPAPPVTTSDPAARQSGARSQYEKDLLERLSASFPCPKDEVLVVSDPGSRPNLPATSRLEPALARELAINSGLLALRLPCASPMAEWNIRLAIMLLRLFAHHGDLTNAVRTIRQIHKNCSAALKEAKAKKYTEQRWGTLERLTEQLEPLVNAPMSKVCFLAFADRCEDVVVELWGPRLRPKTGYVGLIWTFRWAH